MATPGGNIFPKWTNSLRVVAAIGGVGVAVYAGAVITFGFSPQATDIGYAPVQPVPYSHALHAGKLGIDCRYCHTSVETAANANVPSAQICMGCHSNVTLPEDRRSRIALVEQSFKEGKPAIEWVRVHDLPDYAYFNHSAHVRRGVGCVSCHGRVDAMDVVYQSQPLSMQWCLDCHRHPEKHLRPLDQITNMSWAPPGGDQVAYGLELKKQYGIHPSQDCSTCHR
ncbi:MAG: cytochrome c3 family protein [Planctomycetes bacterium]|nr:cytochrome c3 family protein [Planctomycetota bacterium]